MRNLNDILLVDLNVAVAEAMLWADDAVDMERSLSGKDLGGTR